MKKLILMRHAQADEHFQGSDRSRPITETGKEELQKVIPFLKTHLQDCGAIFYSPFLRAEQTAQIVSQTFLNAHCSKEPALGSVFDSFTILKHLEEKNIHSAILVGHAPTLSAFASSLLSKPKPLKFEKSGGVILSFNNKIELGQGKLELCFSPE